MLVYASDEAGDTIVKANIFPNFEKIEEDFKNGVISSDNVEAIIQSEIKNVNKQLVNYKSIRGFNIRETEFSKTTTRKIKRYVEENKAEND